MIVMVKRLEEQSSNTGRRHFRENSLLKLEISDFKCKIDAFEREKHEMLELAEVHRDRITDLRQAVEDCESRIAILQSQKDGLINWQCDHMPMILQAEDDREALKNRTREYTALEKEYDAHMRSCSHGDSAMTDFEARLATLDSEKTRVEQSLATVLDQHEGYTLYARFAYYAIDNCMFPCPNRVRCILQDFANKGLNWRGS